MKNQNGMQVPFQADKDMKDSHPQQSKWGWDEQELHSRSSAKILFEKY